MPLLNKSLRYAAVTLFPLLLNNAEIYAQKPTEANIRENTVDVLNASIELKPDWKHRNIEGSIRYDFRATASTNHVLLHFRDMTIRGITDTNNDTLGYSIDTLADHCLLQIRLARKLEGNQAGSIEISYRTNHVNATDPANTWGSYGNGARFFEPGSTEPRRRKQLWAFGTPGKNYFWFPAFNTTTDWRSSEIRIISPQPLTAISNGELISVKNNADSTRTFHWKATTPYAEHLTGFVIGEYTDIASSAENIRLHNFSYPDEIEATKATTVRLADMFRFMQMKTGKRYPLPTYSQVFVQELPWGGAFNSGFSTISENMVDDSGTHADFFYLWDGVEAQDLASQWFGVLMVPEKVEDSWITRSFSHYFDGLYSEYKNGHQEFLLWNHSFDHATFHADRSNGLGRPVVARPDSTDNHLGYFHNAMSYYGTSVLHMLRHEMGEEKWWPAVRGFVKKFQGKTVNTKDFTGWFEKHAGKSMQWFFNQWLYTLTCPVFEVKKDYNNNEKILTISIRQKVSRDSITSSPVSSFVKGTMHLEMGASVYPINIEPQEMNVYRFKLNQEPSFINPDFEDTWLKELNFDQSTEALIALVLHSRDAIARNNSMIELVNRAKRDAADTEQVVRVRQLLMDMIKSSSYWRLRLTAINLLQQLLSPPYDHTITETLQAIINKESSWLRAAAISMLGKTNDPAYYDLYLNYLDDPSDRVINAAAVAIGRTKSDKAFAALSKLPAHPSWKNQSLISALNGLKELGDPRGIPLAMEALRDSIPGARWTLATPIWDYRIAAAVTLQSLRFTKEPSECIMKKLESAISEKNINDIVANLQLIAVLGDPVGAPAFANTKMLYAGNPTLTEVIDQYQQQHTSNQKKLQ